MNVFIDTERLRDLNSGLGQFCLHLGTELVQQRSADMQLTFLVPEQHQRVFGPDVAYRSASWWRKFWNSGAFDVWHCLHQDSIYLPTNSQSRLILTIHDLNFLERPEYDAAKKARKLANLQQKVNRAAAITTISEYTASVVRQHLTLPDVPLKVIYNGNSLSNTAPVTVPPSFLPDNFPPFFLFLGVIHPKKNVHTLLPLLEAFPDWGLVLAGPDTHPYAAHIREQAASLGLADRLVMPGAVDEATKVWLYQNCGAFLFPSLSEGFGLPVVEAMSCGKPVFVSRMTSLPEIGGKDAYYFDSFEPEQMAETVFEGLGDFRTNPFRADRLRQRASQFTWQRAAKEYLELYQEIVKIS